MSQSAPNDPAKEQRLTALFANFVQSQTNLALLMLGRVPHPQTGEHLHDPESARLFIDQLEMIQERTRGNLSPQETEFINSALTMLRLAFVEALNQPAPPPATAPANAAPAAEKVAAPAPEENAEPTKRFSKKY